MKGKVHVTARGARGVCHYPGHVSQMRPRIRCPVKIVIVIRRFRVAQGYTSGFLAFREFSTRFCSKWVFYTDLDIGDSLLSSPSSFLLLVIEQTCYF